MLELAWQLYITGKHKMGRYISTGSAPAATCTTIINSSCYQVSAHRYAYDANSCWQNRIIIDTPGSYTFTVPSGATCLRTIAVGGGGKSKCTVGSCCGMAGAGGAYVERVDTVASGCTVTIVVGRQEQDTTIGYTNSAAVARTLTAGGAAGCVAGVASGGDWNSNGGCAGCNYNLCSSYSHYCGSCICCSAVTCCGYCIMMAGVGVGINPSHQSDDCCNARYAGGGSAGSWIYSTGGAGQSAVNTVVLFGGMTGGGSTAGGGGGIGYICRQALGPPNCSCICARSNSFQTGTQDQAAAYPSNAGGGGGTKWQLVTCCECTSGPNDSCCHGEWRGGQGGWGGYDNHEGAADCFVWGRSGTACSCMYGLWQDNCYMPPGPEPKRYPWHDIHNMCGSGSAGRNIAFDGSSHWCGSILWANGVSYGPRATNSGEGAGTGGVVFMYCSARYTNLGGMNVDSFPEGVNWSLLCCLGTSGKVCCSDRLEQSLFPNVVTCAGTLGGSGGMGLCSMTSKAGKGGGAGVNRCYILCVCWGGSYNLCNGSGAALAYPPCDLDWRVSNAGTGMAIIYWK